MFSYLYNPETGMWEVINPLGVVFEEFLFEENAAQWCRDHSAVVEVE